jgi:Lytic transglycolase/Putative peptidoglycan binding domain
MRVVVALVPTSRIVLSAGFAAVLAVAIAAAGAGAESGGVGPGGSGGSDGGGCRTVQFGERSLERGDCGSDVETLNWLLRADDYGVALAPRFGGETRDSVRDLQARRGIRRSGVVNRRTRKAIVAGMRRQRASWYGPGFFGNRTACGQILRRETVGVAHRTLPCGTKVVFGYGGRFVRARVIDRGPFVKRRYERDWDLTQALASKLRFEGVERVRTAVVR